MEPTGTTTTTTTAAATTTTGVLAAQDAIVFSGEGAEGLTPPIVAPTVAPPVAPAGTDVFWASLVQAQLCVWELQGAIEGQPDGGHHDRLPRGSWDHGHRATAGSAAMARSISHQRRGPGSTEESVLHQHVSVDGSISPKFMPTDGNILHEHQGHRSTHESVFCVSTGGSISQEHQGHVPTEGSISATFMPMEKNILPMEKNISPTSMLMEKNISLESMPTDESTFHDHQAHGSTYKSIFHMSTDGTISPRSVPTDGSVFHEQQGWRFAYETISHVSMGGSISSEHLGHVPTDGNNSPRSVSMDGNISPMSVPVDEIILQEHMPIDGTNSLKFMPVDGTTSPKFMPMDGTSSLKVMPTDGTTSPKVMPTDGTTSPKFTAMDGTNSLKFMPTDGTNSPKAMPMDGTTSPKAMPTDGTTSPKFTPMDGTNSFKFMPTDGTNSPKAMPTDGTTSPKFMPVDGTNSPKAMPIDGTTSPKFMPMDETTSPKAMPTGGTTSPKFMPMDETTSPKFMPMDGTTSPKFTPMDGTNLLKFMPTDGTISPKAMPTDGTTSPKHQHPEFSEEEEEGDDEDDHGCSSREEDAEEEEDLEEEEPHFHTNPLFQSRVPPPMGARRVPVYRPHSAALQPLLITEGDDTGGATREGRRCPVPPQSPPPFGCHPAGGDITTAVEQGPPLALSDPPDVPPGSGDPPSPLRLQPEWGCRDPPATRTPSEFIPGGGGRDPPGPAYPPSVTSGGGDQDLPPPRPPTPPKPPLGKGYQPPARPSPPPNLPQGGGYQTPPMPPDLPQKRGYQPPTKPSPPPDLPQGKGCQTPPAPPNLPHGGGHQTPPIPPDLPQRGGHQTPPAPPDLPQRGGHQPPAKPSPPPGLPQGVGYQTPPTPPNLPQRGGNQTPPIPPNLPLGGGYQTPLIPPDLPQREGHQPPAKPSPPPNLPQGVGYQTPPTPPNLPQRGGNQTPPIPPNLPLGGGYQTPLIPPDLPQREGHQPPAKPSPPPNLPQGGGYQTPPMPPDLPQGGGYQTPPIPPDLPQRGGHQPPAKPSPPPHLPQGGGSQPPLNLPQPPPSPLYQPMRGGSQPPPTSQPPRSPPPPPYHPLAGGYQPPISPQDPPQPPSPLSSLPPRGPPLQGVLGGFRGDPPMPGHGSTWLAASPGDASCRGGEVVEGPPPVTPSPHPAMEDLPPETGEEPPPDPPASTHGSPPGGSAVTPTQGGPGRRGEAQRLAARLFHLDGFKRSQVAAFLRKNNDFSGMVAQEYLEFFQFGGQTLDQALRSFLQALVLTGETQERERILGHFSRRYHRCNPGAFPSPDAVHSLTCAIMLLNTDLHGQRLGRAMTSAEFVANLSGMMDGQDFPREQLKALYSSIRSEKLAWAADEEEEEEEEGEVAPPGRKKSNPFLDLPGGTGAVTYRRGWLARKVLAEADGKKTPWGRRGWKPFQAVLKGTVLYFLKPGGRTGVPRRPPEPGLFPTPQEEEGTEAEEPLGVHHSLAERASKYTKRPNVFRLQTADWRVFLFQAPTPEEMFSWISRINLVAALFSSPPFPAAVGSQRRFVRPILPAAPSRSSPEEQHRSHEVWMERVAQELYEHQRNLPEKRGRARDLDEYRLKKEYLLYERRRYETYVQVLETWISAGAQDLEGWEAQAGPAVAPPDLPTLTKAHSSPSLVPEPPIAPTIRVKRNISERRTVRKIVPKRNKNLL